MAEPLLTSSEVSRLLRVSLSTVARMASDGRLPVAQRLPGPRGAHLFARATVDAYRAEQDRKWAALAEQAS